MFSTLHGTYFSFQMHFKMSSANAFILDWSKILSLGNGLTLSQTSPGFYKSFENTMRKEKLLAMSNFPSLTVFSTRLGNFLPFSSNFKLSSANSFGLEESEICCSEKG